MSPAEGSPSPAIEMEILHGRESSQSRGKAAETQQRLLERKDYLIGIGLLLIVVLLWTLSNFVTQDLYESGYDKPFLVTYMNTSAFSFYLIPLLIRRWLARRRNSNGLDDRNTANYQPLHIDDGFLPPLRSELPPLTTRETADLALAFCFLWFIANWAVNASLGFTSVASATVLSSMSGFFTLGIGRVFGVERLTIMKMAAVCTSFTGVVFVSLSDHASKSPTGQAAHPGTSRVTSVSSRATIGDFLALGSALFYALYVILLKVRIKTESRVDMQLFFGFVGLLNVLTCWPLGLVMHYTGLEPFEMPPSKSAWQAILINMFITLSSDYLYVLAMLKTTPLVVTVGLSLTIPIAVLGDFLRLRPTHEQVLAGALLVLLSFIVIGLENSKEEEQEVQPVQITGTVDEP
ncbi:vacuolar membrane protein [Crepidotus variabilis]|uniref:Vacuolar membrane protein n=1 Tax=Crepidotus variabilis TaxID=179855 RepID=A0A9P6ENE5_9AGAR|nr:vacuolar membrane protein [Crepidotus variabilis]